MNQLTKAMLVMAASLTFLSTEMLADTIYSVTGIAPAMSCLGNNCFSQILMTSWTSSVEYSDVSISVEVGSDDPTATITAFLTTQVGAGTTAAADQIATVTVSPPSTDSIMTLFAGLTLNAGQTYYLVLTGPTSGSTEPFWFTFDMPTIVTGTGVSANNSGSASSLDGTLDSAYAPASIFDTTNPLSLAINVTGTVVTPVLVPEPASSIPFGAALALGGWTLHGRTRRKKLLRCP